MSDRLSLVGKIVFGICLTLEKWVSVPVCVSMSVQAALHNTLTAPSGSYPYAGFGLVIPSE